jgi:hypothetical protein
MLSGHIRNLLYRIDEVSEEMFSDREEWKFYDCYLFLSVHNLMFYNN